MALILSADIGGTKTLLQLADCAGASLRVVHRARYPSGEWEDFSRLLDHFLAAAGHRTPVAGACLAVAGPISQDGQHARVTNLPWELTVASLRAQLSGAALRLINDFEAIARSIPLLSASDLITLQAGSPHPAAPSLVIGAGTGLGIAQLLRDGDRTRVLSSEGGHMDFAPATAQQLELIRYLAAHYQHVSCETVLSGQGLVNLYRFLRDRDPQAEGAELAAALQEAGDAAATISASAASGDPLAVAAVELFISIYGSIAGNCALLTLPFGGLYLSGGIAPRLKDWFARPHFLNALTAKSKMSGLLQEVPVYLVCHPEPGLLGANHVAKQLINQ